MDHLKWSLYKTFSVDKRPSKAKTARLADVPWRQIMVCLPLYAKGLMWFAMSYTIYTVTTISPLYLKRVHGLNSAQVHSNDQLT